MRINNNGILPRGHWWRAPSWLLAPWNYLEPGRFPWRSAIVWFLAASAMAALEPMPAESPTFGAWYLLANFGAGLLARVSAVSAGWLLLVHAPGRRPESPTWMDCLRLGMGAELLVLWTSPALWLSGSSATRLAIEMIRLSGWPLVVLAGIFPRLGPGPRRLFAAAGTYPLLLFALVGISLLPEWRQFAKMRLDSASSGRVIAGTPRISGPTAAAEWKIWSQSHELLSPALLEIPGRQRLTAAAPGFALVRVSGAGAASDDTAGTRTPSPEDAPGSAEVRALVAGLPSAPASLAEMHRRIRERVRYVRTFIPGDAARILRRGSGDCKAFSRVLVAGARALGLPARQVQGLVALPDGYYAHAWAEVWYDGAWHEWDATARDPRCDARYLRFRPAERATSVFQGSMAIFNLDSIEVHAAGGTDGR